MSPLALAENRALEPGLGSRLSTWAEQAIDALDVSAASRESYRRALRPFLRFWEAQGFRSPSRAMVIEYKRSLEARGLSAATIAAYMNAVRLLFRFLQAEGVCPDVTQGLRRPRKPRGHSRDHLAGAELSALMAAIPSNTLEGLRDRAMIGLMIGTGVRGIEVVRACVGDLRTAGADKILRVEGKGRAGQKDEAVLLVPACYHPIAQYLAARGPMDPDAPLFASHSDRNRGQRLTTRSVRRIVASAMRRAGIKTKRLSAHSLRHTAATLAIANGAPLLSVQGMLRHRDPKTTLVYVRQLQRFGSQAAERFISWEEPEKAMSANTG